MDTTENQKPGIKTETTISGVLIFLAGLIIFMGIITGEIFHKLNFNTRDNYISELAHIFVYVVFSHTLRVQ